MGAPEDHEKQDGGMARRVEFLQLRWMSWDASGAADEGRKRDLCAVVGEDPEGAGGAIGGCGCWDSSGDDAHDDDNHGEEGHWKSDDNDNVNECASVSPAEWCYAAANGVHDRCIR